MRQFTAAGFDEEHSDYCMPVAVRCAVCGTESPGMGTGGDHGEAVRLSDLTEWAAEHHCPPLRVT